MMNYPYPNAVIQVFCKAPIPGQVKTRLMPDVSAQEAADIHQHLTQQTLKRVCESKLCPVQLWCSPSITHPFFKKMAKNYPITLLTQSSGDLGQRMLKAITTGSQSFLHTILIGCDCPSLQITDLELALKALSTTYDIVLAPAEDGGYCLIAMNHPQAELFSNINWGNEQVLANTRQKIQQLKLKCLELDEQWDIDTYADYLRYSTLS